ncbi:hypothetical protein GGF37_006886, partial [Kickxella alabastrina]
ATIKLDDQPNWTESYDSSNSSRSWQAQLGVILETKLENTAKANDVTSVNIIEHEDNGGDDDGKDGPASELDEADAAGAVASDDAVADQLAALMVADNPATVATSGAPEDSDDDDDIVDAASNQQLDVLDMLTAVPLPGNNLTSAIPVCAPYSALSAYKYRVKLVPGTMKRARHARWL